MNTLCQIILINHFQLKIVDSFWLTTVYPEKPYNNGQAVNGERRRFECLHIEYAARDIFGRKPTSHRQVSDDQEAQDDEAQGAHGPWKTEGVNG